jgi:N utilization substance protein A
MNRKSKKAAEPEVKRNEIIEALEALEQEKGISKDYMLERIGQALAAAYKALYKKNEAATSENNVFVDIDQETGAIGIQVVKTVVDFVENPVAEMDLEEAQQYAAAPQLGDQIRLDVDMKTFGRIATQTAKQVIIQGIREAEHSKLVEAYSSRTNQIINGIITRVDQRFGSVYVDLGPRRRAPVSAARASSASRSRWPARFIPRASASVSMWWRSVPATAVPRSCCPAAIPAW